jgi:hypothetical protein
MPEASVVEEEMQSGSVLEECIKAAIGRNKLA